MPSTGRRRGARCVPDWVLLRCLSQRQADASLDHAPAGSVVAAALRCGACGIRADGGGDDAAGHRAADDEAGDHGTSWAYRRRAWPLPTSWLISDVLAPFRCRPV